VASDDIATECEFFLAGRYAERLQAAGRPLPPWVWLNELAHGSMEEMIALADGTSAHAHPQPWDAAMRYLAGELLAIAAGDNASLHAVQNDALLPLELRQVRYWFEPMTPNQMVTRVSAALVRSRNARSE
jgi:hypothetical protein